MKITFDLRSTGLGNNGGSHTIVQSCNTLSELGHDVIIIDSSRNQYTWDKLECDHLIVRNESLIPLSDVVIATGLRSILQMSNLPKKCGRKFVWLRGWETWVTHNEQRICNILRNSKAKILVNSKGLLSQVKKKCGIDASLVYSGFDDKIYQTKERRIESEITVGGLINFQHLSKRTNWIEQTAHYLMTQQSLLKRKVKFSFLSSQQLPSNILQYVNSYCISPSMDEKRNFYNNIDIWLAPTCNEGLHLPPAEAAATGCCSVITNNIRNGMITDYLDQSSSFISDDNLQSFMTTTCKVVNMASSLLLNVGKHAKKNVEKIGNRKDNMIKFVEVLK